MVDGSARCINLIYSVSASPADPVPTTLPTSMSARFKVGTTLSNAVKDLGYRGDVGYNSFLYPNESEARQLLMWLCERLPDEGKTSSKDEATNSLDIVIRATRSEIADRVTVPWSPWYTKPQGTDVAPLPKKKKSKIKTGKSTGNIAGPPVGPPKKQYFGGLSGVHSSNCYSAIAFPEPDIPLATEGKGGPWLNYAETIMPFISSQAPVRTQTAASILQRLTLDTELRQLWEDEWGLSGLSEEEYRSKKRSRIDNSIREQVRTSIRKSTQANNRFKGSAPSGSDFSSFLGSFGKRWAGEATSFELREKLQFKADDKDVAVGARPKVQSEQELQENRNAELQSKKDEIADLEARIAELLSNIKKFTRTAARMENQARETKKENSSLEEDIKIRKQVIELLPDAEENISKLKSEVQQLAARIFELGEKWEPVRKDLLSRYRALVATKALGKNEAQLKLEDLKALKEEQKLVGAEKKTKDAIVKQLLVDCDGIEDARTRGSYTSRILDIVQQIYKLKLDIAKILLDTRDLQKDLNMAQDKAKRALAVADETVFKQAKTNEASRKAYKYLASLKDNFEDLLETVSKTGGVMRNIKELEDQIDKEMLKKSEENLERIEGDYNAIRKENAELKQKLQA
eukprot:UC4_evm7s293